MGWDSAQHWTTKAIVVAEILKDYGDKIVASKSTKSGLWYVIDINDYETGKPLRLIVVDLIEKSGAYYSRKSVSEDMGPMEVDCPLEFLALAPSSTGSKYAEEWRARVVKYHATKALRKRAQASISVGSAIKLINGKSYTVTSVKPLLATDADGTTWRIPARLLAVGGT